METRAPGSGDRGNGSGAGPDGRGGEAKPSTFYAQFDLDPVPGIKQLGEILEHVATRLGDVELSLEIRASRKDGYDDATQRIVSENAHNLTTRHCGECTTSDCCATSGCCRSTR